MKRALGYVVVVMLAAMASARVIAESNPLLGTWKLNVAKSKYTGLPAPKEMTRTVAADGDSLKYTYAGTAADGSSISYGFTVKYDGKDYPMTGSAPGGVDMIAIKRINANTYEATQKKAGKVTANTKVEISKDGKVTTITSKGTDSTSFVAVYDKQ
jgi:Rieske Fe-S protein